MEILGLMKRTCKVYVRIISKFEQKVLSIYFR